eukprot:GFKZ01014453.1.p1 GENE.GFKZ01014453.1~~GFKZ01014453.1.p1  ORF type:complete len:327 (+),score=31.09 GFKZ01014453.1:360-1340(+)
MVLNRHPLLNLGPDTIQCSRDRTTSSCRPQTWSIALLSLLCFFICSCLGFFFSGGTLQGLDVKSAISKIRHDQKSAPSAEPSKAIDCVTNERIEKPRVVLSPLEKMKEKVDFSKVWMGDLEITLALMHLRDIRTYLEWGSGGSTLNFAPFARDRVVSIEHDDSWCEKIRNETGRMANLSSKIDYRCVPKEQFPRTGLDQAAYHWDGSYITFWKYVDEIVRVDEDARYDFVLVDGRARVDCAIRALSFLTSTSKLVLHDSSRIWDVQRGNNGYYWPVQQYYKIIHFLGGEGKQGIAIMQRRAEYSGLEGKHDEVKQILLDKYNSTAE